MKIAIQGHLTRGHEVIQILENLSGKNTHELSGMGKDCVYYYNINSCGIIMFSSKYDLGDHKFYTLEEFEKEFPFKLGDKVLWPVKTGWWSGIIVDLNPDYYKIKDDKGDYYFVESSKLSLYPMQKERNITLTLDKAKEWYKKGGELKEIALQAFTEKELNSLPRSWEEFCTRHNTIKDDEHYIDVDSNLLRVNDMISNHNRLEIADRNIYPSKKSAEAHLAMIQLEQLRNCWWNGWEPIWDISQKYCIYLSHNEVQVRMCTNVARFLTFPTREMAIEFLECFRDLIELARNLI